MKNIDKQLIQEEKQLIQEKIKLQTKLDNCHDIMKNRFLEMATKYMDAIRELEAEYKIELVYGHYYSPLRSYSESDGDIKRVEDYGDFCQITLKCETYDDDGCTEIAKIPYDSKDDDKFVQEFKELWRIQFIAKSKTVNEGKYQQYLKLKEQFEKEKNHEV